MEVIEQMIIQKIDQLIMWSLSKCWYWIPVGLGFLFRFDLEKRRIFDSEKRAKAILGNIIILAVFTLLWNGLYNNLFDDNSAAVLVGGTMVYAFYGLAKKCEPTGGYTESILLFINSVMLTMLSFQPLWGTIFGAIVIIAISYAAYKFWVEKFSDFIEIIIICFEAIVISIIMTKNQVEDFVSTIIYVLFVETAVFMINYLIKFSVVSCCNEDTDDI